MAEKEEEKKSPEKDNSNDSEKGESKDTPQKNYAALSSPEGILMLPIAAAIDLISVVPALNFASFIIGVIIIGGWLVITRPGSAIKKAVKRILVTLGFEVIPIVSIVPTWTWFVFNEITSKS